MKQKKSHARQKPRDPLPTTRQMPAHAAPTAGTRAQPTLSITPINFATFQQGCETDKDNLARDKGEQKISQILKTVPKQALDIIKVAHKPHYDNITNLKKRKKPMDYISFSSPFSSEQNTQKIPQTGNLDPFKWPEDKIFQEEQSQAGKNPYILRKINPKIPSRDELDHAQATEFHRNTLEQESIQQNYFSPLCILTIILLATMNAHFLT